MVLNIDCVRDVLIAIEQTSFNERITFKYLVTSLPQYTEEDITYTCLKLEEGNYIELIKFKTLGSRYPSISEITNLTLFGHEFLNTIREEPIFTKTKNLSKKIGVSSLSAIKDIATNVIADIIKSQFL